MKMTVPSTPKISITNTDNRQIDNLRIAVSFLIDGKPHFDYEDHGTFNRVVTDGLNAMNGRWDGTNFVGNFLYTKDSQSIREIQIKIDQALAATDPTGWGAPNNIIPEIMILKEDGRNITGLRIAAD